MKKNTYKLQFLLSRCSIKRFLLAQLDVSSFNCRPFFFAENSVTCAVYLDMLEAYCFPQQDGTENPDVTFQQDAVPPQFSNVVREALDEKSSGRRIGGSGPFLWSHRRPDLIPLGHVKNTEKVEKIRKVKSFKGKKGER
jgi:hypothetical protein